LKTILISGATGFLGSNIANKLFTLRKKVLVIKRSFSDTSRINHFLQKDNHINIDEEDLEKIFVDNKIDTIIHTACNYGRQGESIEDLYRDNVSFGKALLKNAIDHKCNCFLNTDTSLPAELNNYSRTKKDFLNILIKYTDEIKVINLRLEHMYGPEDGGKFLGWLIDQFLEKKESIPLTKGEQLRDFIHIDDVVSAYLIVLEKKHSLSNYSNFDIGTGNLVTIKEFVTLLKILFDENVFKSKTNLDFGKLEYRKDELMEAKIDNSKIFSLGWKPRYNLENGLKEILRNL